MNQLAEYQPTTQQELARWLGNNARGARAAVYPSGGRTALHYGGSAPGEGLWMSTLRLSRVVDYPARDMTVTVEAGMRAAELAQVLAGERQRLPVDIALAHRATLGGAVATNTGGPHRYGCGTLRDYLIGVSAVDAQGRSFKAGGRVVKNVAGYDLCKLLVGSLGTLAVVTQLTFKLRPVPEATAWLWLGFDRYEELDNALARLLTSAARPVALELLNPAAADAVAGETALSLPCNNPVLAIGLEGSPAELRWQTTTLQTELQPATPRDLIVLEHDDAARMWPALTDFEVASDEPLSFKANLLPSRTTEFVAQATRHGATIQAHAGNGIVKGHVTEGVSTLEETEATLRNLRDVAHRSGGQLVVLQCDERWLTQLDLWDRIEPAWSWMLRLKRELDPQHLLNPQRLFPRAPQAAP